MREKVRAREGNRQKERERESERGKQEEKERESERGKQKEKERDREREKEKREKERPFHAYSSLMGKYIMRLRDISQADRRVWSNHGFRVLQRVVFINSE